MAHFAKVKNGIVQQVIVAEQEFIDNYVDGEVGVWIQTSYNTFGGVHYIPDSNPPTPSEDQSKALRKNYAGIGFTYDSIKDAFIPPKPYPSWILNEDTCLWEGPIPYPDDGVQYVWNEETQTWIEGTE
jgi:hypothetical protein